MTNNRQKGLRMLVTKTAHPRSVRPRVGLRTWYLRFILSQFHLIWHDLSHSNEIKYECEVNIIWLARGMAYSQSRQTLMDIGTGLKGLVLRKFMNVMEHLGTCKCPGNFFFFSGNLLELDMFFLMFVVVVCFLGQNTSQPQHACWHSWPSSAAQIISHVMCEALTRMQCVEDDKSIWPTDPKDIADIQVPVWDLEAGEKARHSTGRMWQVLGSSWSLFV